MDDQMATTPTDKEPWRDRAEPSLTLQSQFPYMEKVSLYGKVLLKRGFLSSAFSILKKANTDLELVQINSYN